MHVKIYLSNVEENRTFGIPKSNSRKIIKLVLIQSDGTAASTYEYRTFFIKKSQNFLQWIRSNQFPRSDLKVTIS
jgi:hypothetical protein